jgi:hypothetical protein
MYQVLWVNGRETTKAAILAQSDSIQSLWNNERFSTPSVMSVSNGKEFKYVEI